MSLGEAVERHVLEEVFPQQAVGVLVGSALPRGVGIGGRLVSRCRLGVPGRRWCRLPNVLSRRGRWRLQAVAVAVPQVCVGWVSLAHRRDTAVPRFGACKASIAAKDVKADVVVRAGLIGRLRWGSPDTMARGWAYGRRALHEIPHFLIGQEHQPVAFRFHSLIAPGFTLR